jgi:outer membrane protein OmpA-like peptidoglycan-associated protein
VEFAGRTAVLEQEAGVEDLARAMTAVPRARIRIEVFVDATSSAKKDASDSMAQAMTVVRKLVSHGIARDRIAQVAKGGKEPVAPNMTAKGRAANRRVEVVALQAR